MNIVNFMTNRNQVDIVVNANDRQKKFTNEDINDGIKKMNVMNFVLINVTSMTISLGAESQKMMHENIYFIFL